MQSYNKWFNFVQQEIAPDTEFKRVNGMSGLKFDLIFRNVLKKSKREEMNEPLGWAQFVRAFLHKDYICYLTG